jgi:hypothetical protein
METRKTIYTGKLRTTKEEGEIFLGFIKVFQTHKKKARKINYHELYSEKG